jgi:hypothetical protein
MRGDRNADQLRMLQKAYAKVAIKHDTLLAWIKAEADKIRDDAATKLAEFADFNLRGIDPADQPQITRVIVRDHFRQRDFDVRMPLAVTPSPMTNILEDAGLLQRAPTPVEASANRPRPNGHDVTVDPIHRPNSEEPDHVF